jgi:hypothetical protein
MLFNVTSMGYRSKADYAYSCQRKYGYIRLKSIQNPKNLIKIWIFLVFFINDILACLYLDWFNFCQRETGKQREKRLE